MNVHAGFTPPETVWIYPKKNSEWQEAIIKEFNIHPVTAQILVSRGFTNFEDIHNFLYAKLPNLFDPSLFNDMEQAIDRILTALQKKEGILIYGDNDVDGMTAAALLTEFLKNLGANVHFFIPNSNIQKKGIFADSVEFAIKNNCSLLITVDCGITAGKEIEDVIKHHIDVIVTDHHEPTSKIPHCIATLNPKLVNSTYPNREITGVGVAFKLAHGITNTLLASGKISPNTIDLKVYLDLVALGTISDMGALIGENRILVRYGLNELRRTKRVGLLKLFDICELDLHAISPMDIASKVAPRLNSLGRIADPKKGVELLLIRDEEAAGKLAKELDLYNMERQKIERLAAEDIENYIKLHPKILQDKAIVLYSHKWHPGVIPIVTTRITKQYNRPTMIIAIEKGVGKGSVRTIPEFSLLPILKKNEKLLVNFGGHDFAAGLTILEENIPSIRKAFIKAANQTLKPTDLIPKLFIDSPIHFGELTFDFMESLNLLEPFGNENPPPILYSDVKQPWAPKVVGKTHLKLFFEEGDRMLESIGFGLAWRKGQLRKRNLSLRIAFTPYINTFLNKSSIQLHIKDFKITD
jgi:single-stranded-DNA-specific exonuclease